MTTIAEENRRLEIDRSSDFKQLQADVNAIGDRQGAFASEGQFAKDLLRWEQRIRDLQREQAIIDSLSFDGMPRRQDDIEVAHRDTFQWVHDPSLHFQHWLANEQGVYWITGDAGSGKSTLIKYLSSHARTHELLEAWAAPKTLIQATFYFWFSGKPLQKSQEGLLRSLLYEIFRQCPDSISSACGDRWFSETQRPWVRQELMQIIEHISLQSRSVRFCFFIDGLDEYQGGPDSHVDNGVASHIQEIIEVMNKLSKLQDIKLCLSSRPWHSFEEAFGKHPERKLYVHEQNHGDIRAYIRDKFEQSDISVESTTDRNALAEVVDELVNNSKGVFLWVFLAVQSLLNGLRNEDRPGELQRRLRETPKSLRLMFERMMHAVEPMYHEQAAQILLLALHAGKPLNVATYFFIGDPEFNALNTSVEPKPWTPEECQTISKQSEVRIKVRCPDLIAIRRPGEPPKVAEDMVTHRVEFLHRTVRDYLALEDTQQQLRSRLAQPFDPGQYLCQSLLMHIMGTSLDPTTTQEGQRHFWRLLDDICRYTEELEQKLGQPQTALLDILERAVLRREESLKRFPAGKISFLGLIVQREMPLYVEVKLPHVPEHVHRSKLPLLYMALRPRRVFGEPECMAPSTRMVQLLLKGGQDPNATIPGSQKSV